MPRGEASDALAFGDVLRSVRERLTVGGGAPRVHVSAEVLSGGEWIELVVRNSAREMVARSGWSLKYFSEETLENVAEWLETQVMRAERRHIQVMSGT